MPRLNLILSFLSLICIFLCILLDDTQKVNHVYILPLSFFLCNIIFFENYINLKKSLVFNLFLMQSFFRFLILPILFLINKDYFVGENSSYIDSALMVMVVEIFILNFVFLFFGKKQSLSLRVKDNICFFKNNLILVLIIILLFGYVFLSGAIDKIVPVWNMVEYVDKHVNQAEDLEYSTYGILAFNAFKILLILFLFGIINNSKVLKENNKKWLYALVIISSSVFMLGLSRFNMILNLIVLFTLLKFILSPKEIRNILFFSLPFIFTAFIVSTLAKFSRYGSEYSSVEILTFSSINAYFAGFANVSVGFDVYNTVDYNDSIFYLINDTFQNIPLFSKFTYDEYKTNIIFNEFIYGHKLYFDQIVPLNISGLFHFGYIGLFLYSPVFLTLALYFERLSFRVKFIGYKYVLIYFSSIFSLVYMFNLSSFYAGFFRNLIFLLIPMIIIFKLTNCKFIIQR